MYAQPLALCLLKRCWNMTNVCSLESLCCVSRSISYRRIQIFSFVIVILSNWNICRERVWIACKPWPALQYADFIIFQSMESLVITINPVRWNHTLTSTTYSRRNFRLLPIVSKQFFCFAFVVFCFFLRFKRIGFAQAENGSSQWNSNTWKGFLFIYM